jgi:hypothetical protein
MQARGRHRSRCARSHSKIFNNIGIARAHTMFRIPFRYLCIPSDTKILLAAARVSPRWNITQQRSIRVMRTEEAGRKHLPEHRVHANGNSGHRLCTALRRGQKICPVSSYGAGNLCDSGIVRSIPSFINAHDTHNGRRYLLSAL